MPIFNGGRIGSNNVPFTGTKSDDPNYSSVSLLLNGNGTNGSTTFTDSSSYGHTVTANGNAQISTTQSKFGGASMYFDGSGDYLTLPNDQTAFDFGTSDFTIESWIYWPGGVGNIFSQRHAFDNNNTGMTWRTESGILRFFYGNGLGGFATPSGSLSTNTWNHIALTRNGNTFTMWINGQSQATNTITASMIYYPPVIGRVQGVNAEYFTGYLDDFRITKGVARYTSNFTPPTAQLPGTETRTFASGVWTALEQCDAVRREIWPTISVWSPTDDIASFSGWYDVSNTSSITESGGYVDQWSDLSGNSRILNGYSSYRPQITSSYQLNGLDTLELNGSTMLHTSTQPGSSTGIQVASGLYHVIAVMKWNTPTGGYYVFSGRGPSGSGYDYHGSSGANIYEVAYTSSYVDNAGHIINGGTSTTASLVQKQINWHIYRIDFSTNDLGYWQGTGFDSRLQYGIRGFNGSIAEILLIDQNVSGLAQKVEGYFAHKWGIQSVLPVSHPYKSSAPI